ncbi:hypothetical protein [Coralloluteibacterium stylophorae]|uniref:Uncharacterized protein n=1 Tax=Coralloluteibacterium stylophorae TaxID=1776034 RepID=A0A8J7VSG2_9GAMM|nr:hypothetical protein [Coralloluteibacterium stylophorae]MBS7457144.1 hypothetical protein [Coralloluteibacterium stylophorae]
MRSASLLVLVLALLGGSAQALPPTPRLPPPERCEAMDGRAREACLLRARGAEAGRSRDLARFNGAVDRYLARLEARLLATGEVRDQLLSARIGAWIASRARALDGAGSPLDGLSGFRPDERGVLLEAVQRRGQDDALVQWMLATDALTLAYPSLRRAAIARLLELEPDNLAARLLAVDVVLPGETLDVAASTRFDAHHYERLRVYLEAFERHPPSRALARMAPDGGVEVDVLAATLAMGLWSDDATPMYQAVVARCAPDLGGATGAPRAACERVGRELAERGDTVLVRGIGLAMQQRLAASEEEVDALRAQRRTLTWQSLRSAGLTPTPAGDAARFRAWMRQVRAPGMTEIELIRSLLIEAGEPLEPPVYWRPQPQTLRRV